MKLQTLHIHKLQHDLFIAMIQIFSAYVDAACKQMRVLVQRSMTVQASQSLFQLETLLYTAAEAFLIKSACCIKDLCI